MSCSNILVYGEIKDGALRKTTLEVLAAGRELAGAAGGKVAAAVVGSDLDGPAGELAALGCDVLQVDDPSRAEAGFPAQVEALARLVKERAFDTVLLADTSAGKDVAPALAVRTEAALATDVVQVNREDDGTLRVVHPVYTGKVNAEFTVRGTGVQVLTLRPHTFAAAAGNGDAGQVEKLAWAFEESGRLELVERTSTSGGQVELTEADIVVSGGRSLKSEENFKIIEELAAALGGAVGASRAAVDAGYQPHSRQVGQTGKIVNPSLYIACGISGAIQHLVGMRTSKVIVAINKDASAPIFQNADYGIVGDLFEVVPLLTEEVRKLQG